MDIIKEFRNLSTIEDWEKTGFLYGLSDDEKRILTGHFNCIKYLIGDEEDEINDLIWQLCHRTFIAAKEARKGVFELFNPVELYKEFRNLYPKLANLKMGSILEYIDVEDANLCDLRTNYINRLNKKNKLNGIQRS